MILDIFTNWIYRFRKYTEEEEHLWLRACVHGLAGVLIALMTSWLPDKERIFAGWILCASIFMKEMIEYLKGQPLKKTVVDFFSWNVPYWAIFFAFEWSFS